MSPIAHRPAGPALLDLPGQTSVAEGPLDLNGMYLAHHAFRRDLASFARAAAGTPVPEREVWRALGVRWERFGHVLHHHHSAEDEVLWPQLLDLVDGQGDADGRATLEAMETEHHLIDPLLAGCAEGFAAMAERPEEGTRQQLAGCVGRTREVLAHHLRHEEEEALPIVQRLLSQEGWDAVEEAAGSGTSIQRMRFLVPWIADGLTRPQLDAAFASVGNVFRVVLWGTRRRYARETSLAFRFA
ncbi:Hemerythrin HHE cation binding domain-containing protein [Blastococcus aggregatus]|uniref:Hemerythrin HHE cation binding domain-containing protein n=1 Tax=Blastococcus aggregatus TaxID=38502 RepID=A0A285V647_9ACTN|nr:hemerythrin domain-containing protein [Blastococcus aggregatus]SOC48506.1 Hemerythrin HHE cation binding domain-containing protein [Blastococcus aggregatus]